MAVSTMERIGAFTTDQWGMITRPQLLGTGVSQQTLDRLRAVGTLETVAHGVYRLSASPVPNLLDLRAAWLQLEPDLPAWERLPQQGLVSHRAAAAVWGISNFSLDWFDFIVEYRKQTRRPDVRIHQRPINPGEWSTVSGLPVTQPAWTAASLLADREDPENVGQLIALALASGGGRDELPSNSPAVFAEQLAPLARRFGFKSGDGQAVLEWLVALSGDGRASEWLTVDRAP